MIYWAVYKMSLNTLMYMKALKLKYYLTLKLQMVFKSN